ncbi:MAG: hypothetical protein IIA41_03140 [SAR324 cluster bacterium]|nr:hypothetical protein [SAR324 cluster bacterium]
MAILLWTATGLHAQTPAAEEPRPQGPLPQGPLPEGVVTGSIVGHPDAGTTVVLLQFRLDAEGQPQGGPIDRTETRAGGRYEFTGVPIDPRTVYQLGTRIEGRLVGSDRFTFPGGERRVAVDLRAPQVSGDTGALRIQELLLIAEPRTGAAWITEVVHLTNPTQHTIESDRQPLELPIPQAAVELEILRMDPEEGRHERLGPKILVYGRFPPGVSVVAFRYLAPAPFGSTRLERTYSQPVAGLRVLTPAGGLTVSGPGFERGEREQFEEVAYDVWSRTAIAAGEPVAIALEGVPIRQWVLLVPLAGFFLVTGGVVVWFLRVRLNRAGEPERSVG